MLLKSTVINLITTIICSFLTCEYVKHNELGCQRQWQIYLLDPSITHVNFSWYSNSADKYVKLSWQRNKRFKKKGHFESAALMFCILSPLMIHSN